MVKKLAIAIAVVAAFTLVGTVSCASHATHRAPNAQEQVELVQARHSAGTGYVCHLEWDGPRYPWYEVSCSSR